MEKDLSMSWNLRLIEQKFIAPLFDSMEVKAEKNSNGVEEEVVVAPVPEVGNPPVAELVLEAEVRPPSVDSGVGAEVIPDVEANPEEGAAALPEVEVQIVKRKPRIRLPFYIGNKFKVEEMISKGAFGLVYKARGIAKPGSNEGEPLAAVKLDRRAIKDGRKMFLRTEYYAYSILGKENGFSEVYFLGRIMDKYMVLVMELHGESLEMLLQVHKQFTLKTVIMLAITMLEKLQIIHMKGIVHRDIKPQNIVIGRDQDKHSIYLIDFGLATTYSDRARVSPEQPAFKTFCGTIKYASLKAQQGFEHMYRDDLESLSYTLVYLLKGTLPWHDVQGSTNKAKVNQVKEIKSNTSIEDLCEGIPVEFRYLLTYSRHLQYNEMPDYNFLKFLFRNLFKTRNYTWDDTYDWMESVS